MLLSLKLRDDEFAVAVGTSVSVKGPRVTNFL